MLFAVKNVYSQKVTLNYFKNTKKEAVKTILQIVVTVAKSNKFPEATLQKHVNFRNFVVCINFSLYTTLKCEIFSIYISHSFCSSVTIITIIRETVIIFSLPVALIQIYVL